MTAALPLLFVITGIFAVWTLWTGVAGELPAIRALRSRMAMPDAGSATVVTFRNVDFAADGDQRIRRHRGAKPKPVTHRLHHFARARQAA